MKPDTIPQNINKKKEKNVSIDQPISSFEQFDRDYVSFYLDKDINKDFDEIKEVKEVEVTQNEKEILLATLKLVKDSGEKIDIENMEALSLKKVNLVDFMFAEFLIKRKHDLISEDTKKKYERVLEEEKQMKKIYYDNYSDNTNLQEDLIEDFDKFIHGTSEYYRDKGLVAYESELYILKYYDRILSFVRFDMTKKHNEYYFKSFNVNKNVQGFGIGQMMCRATLENKAKDYTIIADCNSSKPISSFYIENGFIARKFYKYHNEPSFSIIRDDREIPQEFKTKDMTKEQILEEKDLPKGTIVKRFSKQEDCDFSFLIPKNFVTDPREKRIIEANEYQYIPEKYVLTRYFFDEKSKQWITVFETTKRELRDFL